MELPATIETPRGPSVVGASPELLRELLHHYERVLAEIGYPVELFRPPLKPAEIRSRINKLGLTAPDELVTWYSWHDGSEAGPWLTPQFGFAPLTYAEYSYRSASLGSERWEWNPGWLHVMAPNVGLGVACDGPNEQPPMVAHVSPDEGGSQPSQSDGWVLSLCTPVTWWLEAIESGAYTYDGGRWEVDRTLLPLEDPLRHLV